MMSTILYYDVPFRIKILVQNELEMKGILLWDLPTKALFTLVQRAHKNQIIAVKIDLSPIEKLKEKYENSAWSIERAGEKIKCIEISRTENGEVFFSVCPF
jgi:hypothetical protein